MAGHSKFKNIQHRKGAQDKKRAKVFNKIAREITVAAQIGGGDPDMNPRLRLAMINARYANMPKDRVERAIAVAVEGANTQDYSEIRYEGYGPGGVAIIIEALTDNRNRTAGEVRAAFTKAGGALGETNSVSFMFQKLGSIVYPTTIGSEDTVFEAAVDAGASNIETEEGEYQVYTEVTDFAAVREAMSKKFGEPNSSGFVWKPNVFASPNEAQSESLMKLIDALEDNDDVQTVFANFDISDEIMEKLSAA